MNLEHLSGNAEYSLGYAIVVDAISDWGMFLVVYPKIKFLASFRKAFS